LWRHLHAGDRVGLLRCDDQRVTVKRPSSRRADAIALLNQMVLHHNEQVAATRQQAVAENQLLNQCWHECRDVVTPGTIVYAFCNAMSLSPSMQPFFAHIARHSELQCFGLYDPLEKQLPDDGRYAAHDSRGDIVLDTRIKRVREHYASRFAEQLDNWQTLSQQYRFQFIPVATSDGISLGLQQREH